MNTHFDKVVATSAELIAAEMDKQVLAFFGSEDAMRAYGQDYVIEQTPVAVETFNDTDLFDNTYHIRLETKYRLRLKTRKEREAEARD